MRKIKNYSLEHLLVLQEPLQNGCLAHSDRALLSVQPKPAPRHFISKKHLPASHAGPTQGLSQTELWQFAARLFLAKTVKWCVSPLAWAAMPQLIQLPIILDSKQLVLYGYVWMQKVEHAKPLQIIGWLLCLKGLYINSKKYIHHT